MASMQANKRLQREYLTLQQTPVEYIFTKPKEDNILEWHYVITGPPNSPYHGGEYWGKIMFPSEYPFKPPGIKMLTPNGRFKPDYKICLSMSDYHPDTWNPAWSVSTILAGLLSFMLEDTNTTGAVATSVAEKKVFARQSATWNRQQYVFKELFSNLPHPSPAEAASSSTTVKPTLTTQPAITAKPAAAPVVVKPAAAPVLVNPQVVHIGGKAKVKEPERKQEPIYIDDFVVIDHTGGSPTSNRKAKKARKDRAAGSASGAGTGTGGSGGGSSNKTGGTGAGSSANPICFDD